MISLINIDNLLENVHILKSYHCNEMNNQNNNNEAT